MKYSIVVPCYNEEANLRKLVREVTNFAKDYDMEFILVENGSKDNSRTLMTQLLKNEDKVKMVTVDENQGYGYGVEQGIKAAVGDYIGWIHADMQLAISELASFFKYIEDNDNPQKILLKGRRYNRSFIDYFFTHGMSVFESILLGTFMYDILSIPTIFEKSLRPYLDDATYDFSHDLSVYYIAKKNGYKIVHLPVKINKREAGDSSWNTGLVSRIKLSKRIISQSLEMKKKIK